MLVSSEVQIVEYEARYQEAFKALNLEWITTYFEVEEADSIVLDNPQAYILDKGGKIFVALYNKEPVGVCALIKRDENGETFELAKMAVSPRMQGKKIGYLLGRAVIEYAKAFGAKSLYLESNSSLTPALNLYKKLGFKRVESRPTPYKRADIQMELNLS